MPTDASFRPHLPPLRLHQRAERPSLSTPCVGSTSLHFPWLLISKNASRMQRPDYVQHVPLLLPLFFPINLASAAASLWFAYQICTCASRLLLRSPVRLWGTPWGKDAVRRRGPCRGAPLEIRRDNFSSGSFSLTFFFGSYLSFSVCDCVCLIMCRYSSNSRLLYTQFGMTCISYNLFPI
ncbi:hypothetical protein VPH35_029363 [Triticum aestivum]